MTQHAHPLFLNENEEEPPEVGFIHIIRWENGGKVHVPKAFTAEELQSLDQVKDMFGGGTYELIARDFNNRISRRVRVTLPGKSKPLSADEEEDEAEETIPRINQVQAPANPFPVEGIMGMFMHSMTTQMQMQQAQQQLQMQMAQAQAEAARQQAAEQTKMMIAMMTANKGQDMTPILVAMMQNSSEMFKLMLTKGNSGMGSSEILEAIQIGTNLVKGAQEGVAGQKPGSLEELVSTFLSGMQQMKQAPGMLPPGMAPPGMAPPGMVPQQAPQQAPQQYAPQQYPPEQAIPRPRRRVVQVAPEPQPIPVNSENNGTAGIAEVG